MSRSLLELSNQRLSAGSCASGDPFADISCQYEVQGRYCHPTPARARASATRHCNPTVVTYRGQSDHQSSLRQLAGVTAAVRSAVSQCPTRGSASNAATVAREHAHEEAHFGKIQSILGTSFSPDDVLDFLADHPHYHDCKRYAEFLSRQGYTQQAADLAAFM